MNIKVLGSGCKNCQTLEQHVKEAVSQLGVEATVEKVTDFVEIARFGVMATPALVIDNAVVSSGRVNTVDEIIAMLKK